MKELDVCDGCRKQDYCRKKVPTKNCFKPYDVTITSRESTLGDFYKRKW